MTCSSLLCAACYAAGQHSATDAGRQPAPRGRRAGCASLARPGLGQMAIPTTSPLVRWTVGAGLSFALAMTAGLALSYLPGPISLWAELAVLDGLALIPLLGIRTGD